MIDIGTYLCATACTGRFDYSIPFLRWALQPPEYKAEWHVGVRAEKSGKLVGFITAIPAGMRAWDEKFSAVEINFLCVHKKLRSKRLAPVLIKEVTRRVNVNGIFQAVYTAGAVLRGGRGPVGDRPARLVLVRRPRLVVRGAGAGPEELGPEPPPGRRPWHTANASPHHG